MGYVSADFSRVGPRRPDSGAATWRDAARRGTDTRSAASLPRRRVGRGCAGLDAASMHPRLKVNVGKSEIVPIGEVSNIQTLANILQCRVGQSAYDLFGYAIGNFV